MMKNWGVVGGIAAAVAAGVYILWGPITAQKKRKRGTDGKTPSPTRAESDYNKHVISLTNKT